MAIRHGIAALCLALSATPVMAQSDPLGELDELSRATADPRMGLALAHQQADRGDLIGAVATTERVIALHPESDEALIFHAGLLCQLDDPDGARTELVELAPGGRGGSALRMTCGSDARGRK
jgi:Flp pilus assembly protein TadD